MKYKTGARYLFTKEYDLEGFIDFAAGEGFDFVQLSYEAPLEWVGEISQDRRERIRALSQQHSLPIYTHAVTCGVNVAWTNRGMRMESLKQIRDSIEFARDIGSEVVIVHPGWKDLAGYRQPEAAYALAIASHRELSALAAGYGIKLAIENMPPRWTAFCVDPEAAWKMIQDIDRENMGLTLDVGHANILGGEAILDFIRTFREKILLIHMHDNDGQGDQHRIIGEGKIDFPRLIALMRQTRINPPLCIEASSREDLTKSQRELARLLADTA